MKLVLSAFGLNETFLRWLEHLFVWWDPFYIVFLVIFFERLDLFADLFAWFICTFFKKLRDNFYLINHPHLLLSFWNHLFKEKPAYKLLSNKHLTLSFPYSIMSSLKLNVMTKHMTKKKSIAKLLSEDNHHHKNFEFWKITE